MTKPFLLYISAATDMEAEREILAQSVIAVPADVTWRIEQSPRRNDPYDHQAIAQAETHLLLLGGDIRAPVGLEWMVARQFGRLPLSFLKEGVSRTPAAEDFRRFIELHSSWQPFVQHADLQLFVQQLLARKILDHAPVYGLSPAEIMHLQTWLSENALAPIQAGDTLGGAGESSLVFSKEHYEPSSGTLL